MFDDPPNDTANLANRSANGHRRSAEGTNTVVWLWGEQDAATSGQLRRTLTEQGSVMSTGSMIVNFRDVTFVDASMIGVLLAGRRAHNGRFMVAELPHCARRLFALCNFLDVFVDHDPISVGRAS